MLEAIVKQQCLLSRMVEPDFLAMFAFRTGNDIAIYCNVHHVDVMLKTVLDVLEALQVQVT